MEARILIVDDDALLLSGLRRQLGEKFDLTCVEGGKQAIAEVSAALAGNQPFAVVVCDMRMPDMDGIQTLRRIHDLTPETVLLMLTGNTDQKTAMDAINEAHVHRFFNKPCPAAVLEDAINEALNKYNQALSERDLMERTLAGSVKVLVDLISVNDPVTAELAMRIRDYIGRLNADGVFPRRWQLKISSSLALIGQMALPPDLLRKKRAGRSLTAEEHTAITRAPELARNLIVNIPRLGKVAEAIYLQDRGFDGSGFPAEGPTGDDIPLDARIIKILKDLAEAAGASGTIDADAFARLDEQKAQYDPKLLAKIRACLEVPTPADPSEATEAACPAVDPGVPVAAATHDAATMDAQATAPPDAVNAKADGKSPAAVQTPHRLPPADKRPRPPKHRRLKHIVLVAIAATAVIATVGAGIRQRDQLATTKSEANTAQIGALMEQIEAAKNGQATPTNAFGGTITVKNGTIEATGVPRSACVQASWLLGRKGILTLNGVLAQRLTGTFIARNCRSLDANVISWSPEAAE